MWLLKTSSSWASLLPRLILALTFVPAGWYKISDFQSKALTWSVNFGFPTWATGVAVFVEFFGGIALALGLLTRLAAFGILIVMSVGIWVAHLGDGYFPTYDTYGYQLCLVGLAYTLIFVGGGKFSLDKRFF
jgi:putative oxidoreductase